jgi:hypothetical protein
MKLLKTRILVGKDKDDNGGEEEVDGELEGKVKEALAEATLADKNSWRILILLP